MKLLLPLCALLLCLAACSPAFAQAPKPDADPPDPAQVQQVLALLNNWPDTCSDQLARMAQIDQFSTPVIGVAIHKFADRNVLYTSHLKKIGSEVEDGVQMGIYQTPAWVDGGKGFIRQPEVFVSFIYPDWQGETIINDLMRYLFRVPDRVWVSTDRYDNKEIADWYYYGHFESGNDKTVCLNTLWPFRVDSAGKVSFIWPGSSRTLEWFSGNGAGPSSQVASSVYIAAFDYCSNHFPRRTAEKSQSLTSP